MAIPKMNNRYIADVHKFKDENGFPDKNKSVKYKIVSEDGKNIL